MKADLSKVNKIVLQKKDGSIETYHDFGMMIETIGRGKDSISKMIIKER